MTFKENVEKITDIMERDEFNVLHTAGWRSCAKHYSVLLREILADDNEESVPPTPPEQPDEPEPPIQFYIPPDFAKKCGVIETTEGNLYFLPPEMSTLFDGLERMTLGTWFQKSKQPDEPKPVSIEDRARWFQDATHTLVHDSWNLAGVLRGNHDDKVYAWLREREVK